MEIQGLAFLPVFWVTWIILGECVLVALTVIKRHNQYPFISDTGMKLPESAVYTVVFMVTSIVGAAIAFLQYKFMTLQSESLGMRHIISQRILLAIGWLICIGTAVNAICPITLSLAVHRTAAGTAFICNVLYNFWQSICLYKRSYSSRLMCHIRLAISILTFVPLLLFAIGILSIIFPPCTGRCLEKLIMVGMVNEWIGIFGLIIYQLTNFTDFQHLTLTMSQKGVSISLQKRTQDLERS